jgi:hypothetical protein
MYKVEITKVTKSTKNYVTTKTITETSTEVPDLGMAYAKMLQAFNEGYTKGYITNSTTGEVYMTFTREDSESGTNLNQWLSDELMAYMTKGASICCIPEDKAQAYREEEDEWEEDYYDENEDIEEEKKDTLRSFLHLALHPLINYVAPGNDDIIKATFDEIDEILTAYFTTND